MTKVAEFKLNKFNSFFINLTALLIFFMGLIILEPVIGKEQWLIYIETAIYSGQILGLFTVLLAVTILHELFHGLAYIIFGAKLKFGIKYLNIYTMDISGTFYTSVQMAVILLFPIFILTILLLAVGILFPEFIYWIIVGIIYNIAGSFGDIFMLVFIIFMGKNCKIKDEEYGFGLYT
ncbi:MAG TPA: DUF3267 domain-containing protein [Hungateiclostridium thermocellum]|uniref:Zincin peptidase n=3 Tax=Acetivibrio thermocellus TaxID=1515 RepID=A3DCB7_ACET2|nr:DUF3267 domain-containing protein [Acetivibrio thermocellus]CDG35034.1 hypothetical protein CTHBC1_0365 [Acetivibrio thermocellus BC1]ABN51596.1 hypothetical protein Cthe_0358 [Acetivibrio thermocellus ATCC 27405]ADU74918.1 hypothetical protein Clo1313_1866 [Acetivibrio thermocellus DSM 1313]ALX08878.1 Protein of unknown function DUF3267 [Acetivibrio thermocellus AD2]ANV76628.1 Protein of unknown function DUF3267 [Acetivibrio thermocellus DSM 2360]